MKMKYVIMFLLFLLEITLISCGDKSEHKKISVKKSEQTEQSLSKDGITENTDTVSNFSEGQSGGFNSSKTKITSREVKEHIGDSLTIQGYVADVYISEKVSYLNFENKFPKNVFTCAIFSSQSDLFGDVSKYKGKVVEVTGKITTFKNKPQVILNFPEQIKILN